MNFLDGGKRDALRKPPKLVSDEVFGLLHHTSPCSDSESPLHMIGFKLIRCDFSYLIDKGSLAQDRHGGCTYKGMYVYKG